MWQILNRHGCGHRVPDEEVRVLLWSAERVVGELHPTDFFFPLDEDRSVVANPYVAGLDRVHVQATGRGNLTKLGSRSPPYLLIGHEEVNLLVRQERTDDPHEGLLRPQQVPCPRPEVIRPREPRGAVRLPLRRHAEPQLCWGSL